jgi:hypothetical protein
MSKKISQWDPCRLLALIACFAALVCTLAGCKDSEKSAADRKSRQSVDQAGRILRGNEQGLVMTQSEMEQAAKAASPAQRQRLAEKIKARRDQKIDFSQFDQKLNELAQLQQQYQQTPSAALLQEITQKVQETNQWLIDADGKINAAAMAQNQQRIQKKAQTLLQDAISQASKAKNSTAQISPKLMQGTIQLLMYQDALSLYRQQEMNIRSLQSKLGQLHTGIIRQDIFALYLESQRPNYKPDDTMDDKVTWLTKLVEERRTGLRDQLAAIEKKITALQTQQQQVQQRYDTNYAKSLELEKQYLKLTLQAEQAKGDEQYKVLDQAFELRAGKGEGANRIEGSIYYDAQAQLAAGDLDIIKVNLEYEKLRKDLLTQSIQQITDSLAQLQDPTTLQKLENDIAQAQQNRNAMIEQIQQILVAIQNADKSYQNLRKKPIDALKAAQSAFKQAAQAARSARQEFGGSKLSNTAAHANKLQDYATEELAELWRRTAQHYHFGASLVGLMSDIQELRTPVQTIVTEYQTMAAEAEKQVADLMPDTDV